MQYEITKTFLFAIKFGFRFKNFNAEAGRGVCFFRHHFANKLRAERQASCAIFAELAEGS